LLIVLCLSVAITSSQCFHSVRINLWYFKPFRCHYFTRKSHSVLLFVCHSCLFCHLLLTRPLLPLSSLISKVAVRIIWQWQTVYLQIKHILQSYCFEIRGFATEIILFMVICAYNFLMSFSVFKLISELNCSFENSFLVFFCWIFIDPLMTSKT